MKQLLASVCAAALCAALPAQQNTCTATVDGLGCGPSLVVSFAPVGAAGNQTISIDASGLHADGIGLMAWGQTAIDVPLFGLCHAYTDFIWGHPINPDPSGAWSWSRSWPNSVQGMYRIQVASLGFDGSGQLEITTTDCYVAECHL